MQNQAVLGSVDYPVLRWLAILPLVSQKQHWL